MLIKQIAGRVASELLFYLGHAIHYPMIWFDWAWIHPAYDRLMTLESPNTNMGWQYRSLEESRYQ